MTLNNHRAIDNNANRQLTQYDLALKRNIFHVFCNFEVGL